MAALRSELWRQLSGSNKIAKALEPCAEEDDSGAGEPASPQLAAVEQSPIANTPADVAAAAAAVAAAVAMPAPEILIPVVPPVAQGPHVGLDGEAFFCESAAPVMVHAAGSPALIPTLTPAISPGAPPAAAPAPHSRSHSLISLIGGASAEASGASSPTMSGHSGSFPGESRRSSFEAGAASVGHLTEGHAAEELFYRLNHARQTVDFVKRQAASFSGLTRARMDVWQALELCDELREYEAALHGAAGGGVDPDFPLREHALQTAEACRLAFPQHDWMALVGLLHGLGKLLAHRALGAEPQWAVCGESFPVGCPFHPAVVHAHLFQANPDRRRRAYASPTGVYQPGCGLQAVCMSWSGAEYLYMVLAVNRTRLPPEALFLVRFQKFAALLRPGRPYAELLSEFDRGMLPMLRSFVELAAYRRREVPGRLEGAALREHYAALLDKYIPQGQIGW